MVQGWQRTEHHQAEADNLSDDEHPWVDESGRPTPRAFEVAADESIYPMLFLDEGGTITWASASMERFFGYEPSQLTGEPFHVLVAPESMATVMDAFGAITDAYEPTSWGGVGVPVEVIRRDGSRASCEVAAITRRRSGLPWYVVVIRQAGYERALDQTVKAMASGVSAGDILSRIVAAIENMVPQSDVAIGDHWNGERFAVSAGGVTSLLVNQPGSPWAEALASNSDQWVDDLDVLPRPLATLARAEGFAACWVHPVSPALEDEPTAAIIIWRRQALAPTRFTWSAVRRAGQLLSLALQWDRSHTRLAFAAHHDTLTGLANRQAFRERLEHVTSGRSPDMGGQRRATLFYVDLDRFKPVNDQLGHLAGDHVLTVVAERLSQTLRPGDMAARMGGDEFAILCERLPSTADAELIATRVLEVLRRPIDVGETAVVLDASVGLADVRGGQQVDSVLAAADEAMRAAKNGGRGHWRWFSFPAPTG